MFLVKINTLVFLIIVVSFMGCRNNTSNPVWKYNLESDIISGNKDISLSTFSQFITCKYYKDFLFLIFYDQDCQVCCIDLNNGESLWNKKIWSNTNFPYGDIQISNNCMYFLQNENEVKLCAINLSNGKEIWSINKVDISNENFDPFQKISIKDDTLYTFSKARKLLKINTLTSDCKVIEIKYESMTNTDLENSYLIQNQITKEIVDGFSGKSFIYSKENRDSKFITTNDNEFLEVQTVQRNNDFFLVINNLTKSSKFFELKISNEKSISSLFYNKYYNAIFFYDIQGELTFLGLNSLKSTIVKFNNRQSLEISDFNKYLIINENSVLKFNTNNDKIESEVTDFSNDGKIKLITDNDMLIMLTKNELEAFELSSFLNK